MKHIILISALLVLLNSSYACSCSFRYSFCDTHDSYDLTASCVVIDAFPHGISLKVIDVLHGSENRDTITLWDLGGPYNMCNDSITDASAAYLGGIGDTLILALPKIDTLKNAWDVVGDYRTPGFQCNEYRLWVKNNVVHGFISGSPYCYYLHNCLNDYNYNAFIIDFPTKSLSCQTWLSTDDLAFQELLNYYPNPTSGKITLTSSERGTLTITNDIGQFVTGISITDYQTQISTDKLRDGIYFLTFQTERNIVTRKLIVQQ